MEQERHETYERIPWEALDSRRTDPNRLVILVSAAIAVGALAFSFMRGQPVAPPESVPEAVVPPSTIPAATTPPPSLSPPPMVVSEADLYAVDGERLAAVAAAHAEWFAVEYLAVDGSEASRATLAALLPAGVPLPEAPEGTQVFVDWAGAVSVSETTPLTYEVEVLIRSLVSGPDGGFVRQPPRRLIVEVALDGDGLPRVTRPPSAAAAPQPAAEQAIVLGVLPESVTAEIEATVGSVVGGEALPTGGWRAVVMAVDPDGVTRPRTIVVP